MDTKFESRPKVPEVEPTRSSGKLPAVAAVLGLGVAGGFGFFRAAQYAVESVVSVAVVGGLRDGIRDFQAQRGASGILALLHPNLVPSACPSPRAFALDVQSYMEKLTPLMREAADDIAILLKADRFPGRVTEADLSTIARRCFNGKGVLSKDFTGPVSDEERIVLDELARANGLEAQHRSDGRVYIPTAR